MGSGGAKDRRKATPDANLSNNEIAEDARRQARDARACDRLLADLIRFHGGQGRKPHAGRPRKSAPCDLILRLVRSVASVLAKPFVRVVNYFAAIAHRYFFHVAVAIPI